ncbi:MAG: glycoside hydrolase family 95 protein [Tannerellaceae bacterium]|jgi:alpha-L-fucosidase 2|nr:glycoside hydrolase family 95 protein [Tannerellaceae bacterium]
MKNTTAKRFHFAILTIICLTIFGSVFSAYGSARPQSDLNIWYDTAPGEGWTDPLPIGNGHIGALVYGKVNNERIALNESSFWSGAPHDYNDPDAGKYFPQIRDLVFDGKFKEAEKMADEHFYGKPVGQQAYEPLGDLRLLFYGVDANEVGRYVRDLDMATGITSVSYMYKGVSYTREVFVSYPDRALVMRIKADRPGMISFDAWLESHFADRISAQPGLLALNGAWENSIPHYWLIGQYAEKGMAFQTLIKVNNEGGESIVHKNKLRIRNADAATIILAAATSHVSYRDISGNPAERNQKTIATLEGKDYATLLDRHKSDFGGLMNRVVVDLGDDPKAKLPVNKRIQDLAAGEDDPHLAMLCFQFGRYMLVSSSRPGGQPANLQAIWNERLAPPWGSKYTININTQMNYWPAEVTNLSECHLPLISMVKDLAENGRKTAQIYYGANGWVTHHNVDLWRGTAPVDAARFGMWPVGGAWLCRHLWEHYAFTGGNREILREIYPVLKGAAEFLAGILTVYPKTGHLVTPFSMSPEHGYYFDDSNRLAYLSPGPTMDIAIMRELFGNVIEASRTLGLDAPLRKQLEAILPKLPPYKVNSLGYVQEWIEDWRPQRGGHDVSPYFPFFPGNSILLHRESDLDLVNAYRYWLEARGTRGSGFPGSWNICMWARMERGDRTSMLMQAAVPAVAGQFLRQGTGAQVDGPFGFTAGVAESLIQSHAGEISLLPALPSAWAASGEVCGLCARGGYVVDMKWEKGRLISARISNPAGGQCKVRYNGRVVTLNIPKNSPLEI